MSVKGPVLISEEETSNKRPKINYLQQAKRLSYDR